MILNNLFQKTFIKIYVIITFFLIFFFLWYITGKIPGASLGDEVYYSEVGFSILKYKTFSYNMRPDILGSNIIDFTYPVQALLQYVSFKSFGVSQFSMMFISQLFLSLLIFINFLHASKKKSGLVLSIIFSISFLYVPELTKFFLRVRPEIVYIFITFLQIYLLNNFSKNKNTEKISFFLVGILSIVNVITYYSFLPIFFIFTILLLVFFSNKNSFIINLFYSGIGSVIVISIFLAWIYPDFNFFIEQNISKADAKYNTGQSTLNDNNKALISLFFILLITILLLKYNLSNKSKFYCFSIILFLCGFIFSNFHYAICILLFSYLVLELIYEKRSKSISNIISIYFITSFHLTLIIFYLLFSKASPENRNYNNLIKLVEKDIDYSRKVATDRTGWLLLREKTKKDQLIEIVKLSGGDRNSVIPILFDADKFKSFSSVIISTYNFSSFSKEYKRFSLFLMNDKNCIRNQYGEKPYSIFLFKCKNL